MRPALALLAVMGCAGCGASSSSEPADAGPIFEGGGVCMADVEAHADEGASHVTTCSAVTYQTNPPSSGNHYPIWAAYKTYGTPVPHGFSVHNLEHGAIVVSYNCPSGCDADLAKLHAWASAPPADPDCGGTPIHQRLIVTPDPTLDVPFAAAGWQYTMRASCFDDYAFTRFYQDHIGHGREVICGDGQDIETIAGGVANCLP